MLCCSNDFSATTLLSSDTRWPIRAGLTPLEALRTDKPLLPERPIGPLPPKPTVAAKPPLPAPQQPPAAARTSPGFPRQPSKATGPETQPTEPEPSQSQTQQREPPCPSPRKETPPAPSPRRGPSALESRERSERAQSVTEGTLIYSPHLSLVTKYISSFGVFLSEQKKTKLACICLFSVSPTLFDYLSSIMSLILNNARTVNAQSVIITSVSLSVFIYCNILWMAAPNALVCIGKIVLHNRTELRSILGVHLPGVGLYWFSLTNA